MESESGGAGREENAGMEWRKKEGGTGMEWRREELVWLVMRQPGRSARCDRRLFTSDIVAFSSASVWRGGLYFRTVPLLLLVLLLINENY